MSLASLLGQLYRRRVNSGSRSHLGVDGDRGGSRARDELCRRYDRERRMRAHVVQTLVPAVHTIGSLAGTAETLRNCFFSVFPHALKTPIFDATHRAALGWSYTAPDLGQGLYVRLLGYAAWRQLVGDELAGRQDGHETTATRAAGAVVTSRDDQRKTYSQEKALWAFHAGTVDKTAVGSSCVVHGPSLFARLLAFAAQLPAATPHAHLEVAVQVNRAGGSGSGSGSGGETWHRQFTSDSSARHSTSSRNNVSRFSTRQWIEGEHMVEQHGPLQFVFDLRPVYASSGLGVDDADAVVGFDHELLFVRVGFPGLSSRPWACLRLPSVLTPRVHGTTRLCSAVAGGNVASASPSTATAATATATATATTSAWNFTVSIRAPNWADALFPGADNEDGATLSDRAQWSARERSRPGLLVAYGGSVDSVTRLAHDGEVAQLTKPSP